MSTASENRFRFPGAALLLLVTGLVIAGLLNLVEFQKAAPTAAPTSRIGEQPATADSPSTSRFASTSPTERLFLSAGGASDPRAAEQIASALNYEFLLDVTLQQIDCRGRICKVTFDGETGDKLRPLVARQLAETFNAMVIVHSSGKSGEEKLVYVEIPAGH